jgi:hypothetical protein
MGGFGSGRQKSYNGKPTVEQSFVLDLSFILKQGPRTDIITWTIGKNEVGSITYFIGTREGRPTLTLEYTYNGESIRQNISIYRVSQPYGGHRYWIECSLHNGSISGCGNRCYKLYLPPGQKYFGCRQCHGLTYQSCNTSHRFDQYYKEFVQQHGPYSRKRFNEELSGKGYYRYFRTRKAAKKWYAKVQAEKELA